MALSENTINKMKGWLGQDQTGVPGSGILGDIDANQTTTGLSTGILGTSSKTTGLPSVGVGSPLPPINPAATNMGSTNTGSTSTQNTGPTASTNATTPVAWSGTGPRPSSDPGPSGPDPGNMWDSPGARAARGLPPLASQAATGTTTTAILPAGSATGQAYGPGILGTPTTSNLPQTNDPSSYAIGGVNYGLPPPQSTVPTDTTGAPTTPTTPATPTPVTATPGAPAKPATTGINTVPGTPNNTATQLNASQLTNREIDPNELVNNQLTGILDDNGKYIQGARDRAMRTAARRGLQNSSLNASGGEAAAIEAAMPIAQADAATYGKRGDYNTSLFNQAYMYNVDAENNFKKLNLSIDSDKESQMRAINAQLQVAGINAAASGASAMANLQAAQLSAETSRLNAKLSADTSTGNLRAQIEADDARARWTIANNIVQNMEFDAEYKKKLVDGLGPNFALFASGIFDASMQADLTEREGDTSTYGGKNYIMRGGQWVPV